MSGKKDVLHVGIDLGTSRSAIAASSGERHVVESYVGWPVDMVARKVVKKPVLPDENCLAGTVPSAAIPLLVRMVNCNIAISLHVGGSCARILRRGFSRVVAKH